MDNKVLENLILELREWLENNNPDNFVYDEITISLLCRVMKCTFDNEKDIEYNGIDYMPSEDIQYMNTLKLLSRELLTILSPIPSDVFTKIFDEYNIVLKSSSDDYEDHKLDCIMPSLKNGHSYKLYEFMEYSADWIYKNKKLCVAKKIDLNDLLRMGFIAMEIIRHYLSSNGYTNIDNFIDEEMKTNFNNIIKQYEILKGLKNERE